MEEKRNRTREELQLSDDTGTNAGVITAVIVTSVFFIAAFGTFMYFDRRSERTEGQEVQLVPGYFTPGMIRDIFEAMDSKDEFRFPPIVSRQNESKFLGKDLENERDLQQVYDAIRSYRQPEQPSIVRDKLEKLYYLYINRAESAERARDFKRALYYYRKAAKLKPRRKEVLRAIDVTERTIAAIELRDAPADLRSYGAVKQAVESKLDYFRYLYRKELEVSPDLGGEVSLELFIEPDGPVSRAEIIESTLGEKTFENKLLGTVRMWNFGAAEGQKEDTCVLLRFYFKERDNITVYVGELCETDKG